MPNDATYPLALPIGTVLAGQYIIEEVLGQGGFGITYKANDHKSGQKVAVKEFFPDSMATRTQTVVTAFSGERGESFVYGKGCFLQEAETLAEFIGNRNIVRVHSYFEENGTAYFVMDFVEGISFDHYIKEHGGRVSYEEAEKILVPVMDALAAVHSRGIVHRDVTPDNIYITKDGTVKLLDFGAARYSLGDKSRSLDVVLKHGFAPKEQYTRRGRQGPFTDVYTLGASFYFAITGRRPPDSIDRLEEDELVDPSSLGVVIAPEKEDAILKAMSVQPQDRFQNMSDFKNALTVTPQKAGTDTAIHSPVQQRFFTGPAQQSAQQIPQSTAMQQIPQSTPMQGIPQSSPMQGMPQSPPMQGMPQSPPMQGMPQSTPMQGMPQNTPMQGMPQYPNAQPKKKKWVLPVCISVGVVALIAIIVVANMPNGRSNDGSVASYKVEDNPSGSPNYSTGGGESGQTPGSDTVIAKGRRLIGNDSNNIQNGAMLYYDGETIFFNYPGRGLVGVRGGDTYSMDESGDVSNICVDGDLVYYLDADSRACTVNKDGTQSNYIYLLSDMELRRFWVAEDGFFYLTREDQKFGYYSEDGSVQEEIDLYSYDSITFLGDYIYYYADSNSGSNTVDICRVPRTNLYAEEHIFTITDTDGVWSLAGGGAYLYGSYAPSEEAGTFCYYRLDVNTLEWKCFTANGVYIDSINVYGNDIYMSYWSGDVDYASYIFHAKCEDFENSTMNLDNVYTTYTSYIGLINYLPGEDCITVYSYEDGAGQLILIDLNGGDDPIIFSEDD